MTTPLGNPSNGKTLAAPFAAFNTSDPQYASQIVETMLSEASAAGASDVHLQPGHGGLELKYRIDGVLAPICIFPGNFAANVVARLKVLADLLTYHTDRPQEGRIRRTDADIEMRVSTFPTIHGERAVVRLFGGGLHYQRLDDLGGPKDDFARLRHMLSETSGAIVISGPAGSGKTTTAYACLREIAQNSSAQRSLMSIEDPIEVAVPGVAQSQVNPQAGLDLATGLRFLMRQDPEVILVGEIRDRPTAEAALQASLTGHLLLTTFHAGSAAETVGRLLEMGIEPYILQSGLLGVINQRLLRRLCKCAKPTHDEAAKLGLPVKNVLLPVGCEACRGTGFTKRLLVSEMFVIMRKDFGGAVLSRSDSAELEHLAIRSGMTTRWQRACEAVDNGLTTPAEVRRVLGFSDNFKGTKE
jgi:type II secretory ATPase GspE/PulE/Tfp pilus assembly ATPase PilB-like protein